MTRHRSLSRFAWFFLAYLVAVILFGAWVRIAGAGAGCGNHWPTCQGVAIPPSPSEKTIIEYTHRVTSALCGVFGLLLIGWVWRVDRSLVKPALATMFFILIEALVGAVLVKKELVAEDASAARAVVIALHLANTLLLTASAATVAWRASGAKLHWRGVTSRALLATVLLALVLTNMTGAVTALGDTLFPRQPTFDSSLFAKVRADLSPSQHFLVRLRILHPVIAVAAAGLAGAVFLTVMRAGVIAVGAQVVLGFINVALGAPGWMQIVHLLMAQIVWILAWIAAMEMWRSKGRAYA